MNTFRIPYPKHLSATIPHKHMYYIWRAHKHMSLVYVNMAETNVLRSPIDPDRL